MRHGSRCYQRHWIRETATLDDYRQSDIQYGLLSTIQGSGIATLPSMTKVMAVCPKGKQQDAQAKRHASTDSRPGEPRIVCPKEGLVSLHLSQFSELKWGHCPALLASTSYRCVYRLVGRDSRLLCAARELRLHTIRNHPEEPRQDCIQ